MKKNFSLRWRALFEVQRVAACRGVTAPMAVDRGSADVNAIGAVMFEYNEEHMFINQNFSGRLQW
jgi:hypothetical protein